jgi:Tol biopolymer transport system component
MLAISASPASGQPPAIYTLPITGGASTRITQSNEASYIHGWSPDGKTLVFSGRRNGAFNIYTIPAIGGDETQLTHNTDASKKEDSPEYSPNGQFIYFNSQRTGSTQIWRMKPDGTAQEQLTTDDFENCFPHPSPNGRQLAFLSYEKGAGDHPANKDVIVRIMNLTSRQITALTQLVGGLGTLNVPSWGPDSLHLAFVSYPAVP